MNRTTLIGIIVAIVIIAAAAVGLTRKSNTTPANSNASTSTSAPASNSPASSSAQVDIKNMMFTPSQVTVTKGATVTWTNNDSVAHTVTADINNTFDSGTIDPGKTFSYTFNVAGSYQYHCSIHSSMRGTIVVR